MADVSYVPGPLTAVAGDRCRMLVEAPPDSPVVAWLWQRLGQGAGPEALLSALLGAGFDGLPGFALLAEGGDGRRRLFCRGAVTATVAGGPLAGATVAGGGTAANGTIGYPEAAGRVDGGGLLTWRECLVPVGTERIFLGEPPQDSALRLPAATGIVLAGCVIADLTGAAARDTVPYGTPSAAAETVHPDTVISPAPAAPDTVTLTSPPPAPPDTITVAGQPGSAGPVRPGPVAGPVNPAGPVGPVSPIAAPPLILPPPVTPAPVALSVPPVPPAPDGEEEYDFFWGATMSRSVEDAAIRPADGGPGDARSSGPYPGVAPPSALQAHAPQSQEAQSTAPLLIESQFAAPQQPAQTWQPPGQPIPGAPGGLIDAMPWGRDAAGSPGEAGSTVKRTDLAARSAPPPDKIGPSVPALVCPSGHVNPPNGAACRRCGASLPADPVVVPRPVLGVLRLSTGDLITLDRGVLMGRSPRADFAGPVGFDGPGGEERPHLVRLPSADGDISRTHLRISLDGWHVLITDLNSMNGTLVTLPGHDPQQLRPGETVPIKPGTVVTLADGIDFRYEVSE